MSPTTLRGHRYDDLKRMLRLRRREVRNEVHSRVRDERRDRPDVGDTLDQSDAHVQGDIGFALIQMRADTMTRIDEALARLDAGKYGSCAECAGDIGRGRLQALVFAVRCQACEKRREQALESARQLARGAAGPSLFSEAVGA